MSITIDGHEAAILNVLRGTALPAITTPHLALFSVAPAEDGTGGTELSVAGYARQPVTFTAPAQVGGAAQIGNSATVAFGPFTADAPSIIGVAVMTAASGGSMLYYLPLTTPRDPAVGDSATFAAGALTISQS